MNIANVGVKHQSINQSLMNQIDLQYASLITCSHLDAKMKHLY